MLKDFIKHFICHCQKSRFSFTARCGSCGGYIPRLRTDLRLRGLGGALVLGLVCGLSMGATPEQIATCDANKAKAEAAIESAVRDCRGNLPDRDAVPQHYWAERERACEGKAESRRRDLEEAHAKCVATGSWGC